MASLLSLLTWGAMGYDILTSFPAPKRRRAKTKDVSFAAQKTSAKARQSYLMQNLPRWKALRAVVLRDEPNCRKCAVHGLQVKATKVDHIIPRSRAPELTFERKNLQPLCDNCHESAKKFEEARGYDPAIGEDGWPTDPNHPFNVRSANAERQVNAIP